jgi:hypothetical protein
MIRCGRNVPRDESAPADQIECPACGRIYEDWHRASISLDLEGWDAGDPEIRAYLRECSTGTCRHCGHAQLQPRTNDSGRSR